MSKYIRDLPKEIQEIVHQRQQDAGNIPTSNLELENSLEDGNFYWSDSEEGWDFWDRVNKGNYSQFYKLYPSKPMQSSQAIKKRSLIELHHLISCINFKQVIEAYLAIAVLKFDEDLVNISDDDINRLYKEGDAQQIKLCEAHGIKKPQTDLPKSWEELRHIDGFYIDAYSDLMASHKVYTNVKNRNVWPTQELAKASVALAQLLQIQQVWRNGWVPDFENNAEYKHVICVRKGKLTRDWFFDLDHKICLPTRELCDQFFNEPKIRELLEIAKPLL